jgi:hypothetical protein
MVDSLLEPDQVPKTKEKVSQGRPWKVQAVFEDFTEARRVADELAASSGAETKVKLKGDSFTVRIRYPQGAEPSEHKRGKRK